jgi:hypothetical protein
MTEPGADAERRGVSRPAPIGIVAAIAIAAIIAAVVLIQQDGDPVAEASPTSSAAVATTQPSAEATPSTSADPDATATAAPAVPETWTEAAIFSEPGKRYALGDLMEWSGGLVAAGTLYEEEARSVFGPPPPRSGRIWRSTDGSEWTDATPPDTFADVELLHLFETDDGALVVVGHTYPEQDSVSVAWETMDGETWTPADLTGPPFDSFVSAIASGREGHLADEYFSADGRSWQQTLERVDSVAAGDEGFVVSTTSEGGGQAATQWQASGDGLEWVMATKPDDGALLAAPRGADWLAATTTVTDESSIEVATWSSANGLDWSPLGSMPLGSVDFGEMDCDEAPAILHGLPSMVVAGTVLASACGEGAVVTAGGSYATIDGVDWTRLPFGDQAYAAGAAEIDDRVVIGTDARTNQADVVGVTFWISDE